MSKSDFGIDELTAESARDDLNSDSTTEVLCPSFFAAMDILGKRWNGVLIQAIRFDELRFGGIKALVPGISDGVLTIRLGELLRCELVERRGGSSSSHALYALTEKGRALLPVLDDLTRWSEQWVPPTAHQSAVQTITP